MKQKVKPKPTTLVKFSFKSALFVVLGILLSSLVFPLILDKLGLALLPLRVLAIGATTGFVISYSLYNIDSKRGYTKGFWITFGLVAIVAAFISYFWVYNIYYL